VSAGRVLVVDDDEAIRRFLATELRAADYEVSTAASGEAALELFEPRSWDLVITDLAMPGAGGFALIAAIRRAARTPIVVISVREEERDKVRALDLGADDYVTKPFSVPELLARVRAQLRRERGRGEGDRLEFPGLAVDLERRTVVQGERAVHLTPTEFALLELLARNAGRPVSLRQIVARVWNGAPGTSHDTVRVHVGALRRKLEPDPSNPRYIVTEPWVGYRFVAEPLS